MTALQDAAAPYDAEYYAARYRYHPTSMYWWSVRYYARLVLRHLPKPVRGRPRGSAGARRNWRG